jgi:MFS family permease
MSAPEALARKTFAAFAVHNFRLYFAGQVISVSGAWMQRVAQSWLVLEITGSGAAVGAITAVQFLPLLLLAPVGGLVADRADKRKVWSVTQSLAGLIALTLGALGLTDVVALWMVFVLAGLLGVVGSFDNPARQTFVMEMVGRSRLTNAVALNSVLVNSARIIGPAVGGLLIVTVGIGWCFVINAVSYLVFITAMALMRSDDINRTDREERQPGQLREALRYVRGEPVLLTTLVMSAMFGLFAYEFEVVLPLLARFTFGGDADTFGIMFAAMGLGAVAGGLYVASRDRTTPRGILVACLALAAAMTVTTFVPSLWMSYVTLVVIGATSTAFLTMSNSVLQLGSEPKMRGRVIGLRAMAVLGARPIGAPIVGWVGEHMGPRYSLAMGALACFAVVAWAWRRIGAETTVPVG